MNKRFLFIFSGIVFYLPVFASFPVVDPEIVEEAFKLDKTAFIIGLLTTVALPYSLILLLLFRKKNSRKSLARGWLIGAVAILILFLAVVLGPESFFIY